jgi:Defence against restriction A N-terminal
MNNLPRIAWDGQANPKTIDMPSLMYAMRRADTDGLLLDSCTFDELTAENDGVMTLDALVVMAARLEPKMEILSRLMSGVGELKVVNMQTSNPLRKNGAVHVAVMWELSDGQTVSAWFHNPDTTPAKLTPMDDLVSWKWLLNKRDVTIVAAPERGTDLSPREVARRLMRLAEKNSAAFQKANANKSEKVRLIAELEMANGAKRVELESLLKQLEVAQFEADTVPRVKPTIQLMKTFSSIAGSGSTGEQLVTAYADIEEAKKNLVDDAPDASPNSYLLYDMTKSPPAVIASADSGVGLLASLDALAVADVDEKEQGAATALSLHEILIGSGWAETHNSADQRVGMKGRAGYSMFPLPSGNGEWSIAMFIQDHGNSGITDIDKIRDVNPKFKQFPSKKSIIIPVDASENDLTEIATAVNEVGIRLNSIDSIKWDDFVSQNPAVQTTVDALNTAAKTGGASIEWGFFEDAAALDSATDTKQAAGIALDSVQAAIEELKAAMDVAKNNAPINEASGNLEQAELERKNAAEFQEAIDVLETLNVDQEWDAVPALDSASSVLKLLDESVGHRIPNKELSALGIDLCLYGSHYELYGRIKSNGDVVNIKYKGKDRFSKAEIDEVVSLLASRKTDGFTLDSAHIVIDDARKEVVLDCSVLDGDFRGHPFRGNQYKNGSQESGSAVHASMRAKHAERKGDKKAAKTAHKAAHYAHMAASVHAKGKAKGYHTKMANFHATKAI